MNEIEYSQLAGHITEKLDNTAEYEDWLTIQDYIERLQSNLIKEQLAYKNLRDTFDQQYKQLKQRYEVIDEAIQLLEYYYIGNLKYDKESQIAFRRLLSILYKYKGVDD